MELVCPNCSKLQSFADDEIFPNCKCGHIFETLPILDKALNSNPQNILTKIKKSKSNNIDDIIITTSSANSISKFCGIVAVNVVLNETIAIEEFASNSPIKKDHYQIALSNLLFKLKSNAIKLGANGIIGLNIQHCVLTSSLGGPGIIIFAHGSAVIL